MYLNKGTNISTNCPMEPICLTDNKGFNLKKRLHVLRWISFHLLICKFHSLFWKNLWKKIKFEIWNFSSHFIWSNKWHKIVWWRFEMKIRSNDQYIYRLFLNSRVSNLQKFAYELICINKFCIRFDKHYKNVHIFLCDLEYLLLNWRKRFFHFVVLYFRLRCITSV